MTTPVLLVTGSSGLIGSEVAAHFDALGWQIHGVDNNQRAVFFGPAGDTRWNQSQLARSLRSFTHHELDIRDRAGVLRLVAEIKPAAIVHTAAQPTQGSSSMGS
jgi:CDP-paratose 2-epimerase